MQLLSDIGEFVTEPFVADLDLLHLFLLVGLVLVFALAWGLILGHMKAATSAALEAI